MGRRLSDAVAALEAAGATVRRGVPATDPQIAALQEAVGCRFPADYVAFLREHGALSIAADTPPYFSVFGHAPGDDELDVVAAAQTVAREFEPWHRERVVVSPAFATQHFPSEATVFGAGGEVLSFWRGRLEPSTSTFEQTVAECLEAHAADRVRLDAGAKFRRAYVAELLAWVPAALRRSVSPCGFVLERPTDGAAIEVRFGDGREYDSATPGLFVFWTEPNRSTLVEMNRWNRAAIFVRGAVQAHRDRYRGGLPAVGLEPARFVHALAHDAGLPIHVTVPAGPTLADVRAALVQRPNLSAEERLFRAVTRVTVQEHPIREDGNELVVRSTTSAIPTSRRAVDVHVGVDECGLLRVRHAAASTKPPEDLLFVANVLDGRDLADGDVNFDMEGPTRVTVDEQQVTFSFTTTLASIANGAYRAAIGELERAVARSGLVAPPDPNAERSAALAARVGAEVGPATRALLASLPFTPSRIMASPHRAVLDTPWGRVVPLLTVQDVALLGSAAVEVGLVAGAEATTDACRVVGILGDEAALLAADVPSFVSVMVLGTTGFAFDGDDGRAWRDYRELVSDEADLGRHFFHAGERLCRTLGIAPAPSVAAVLARAGEPRRARVSRG